jgi:hypothetical protein
MSLTAAAGATVDAWHGMLAARDLSALPAIIAPAAVFRSPMRYAPYEGSAMVALILRSAFATFEDFVYERQFTCGQNDVVLEFSARIGDRQLKGIDMIRFDAEGKIVDFEVMIRPATALTALGEIMGRKLAAGAGAASS